MNENGKGTFSYYYPFDTTTLPSEWLYVPSDNKLLILTDQEVDPLILPTGIITNVWDFEVITATNDELLLRKSVLDNGTDDEPDVDNKIIIEWRINK